TRDEHSFPPRRSSDLGDLDAVMAGIMENAYAWGESLGISREDMDAIVAAAGIIPEVLEVGMHIDGADETKSQLAAIYAESVRMRSEEHTSELQSRFDL